MDMTTGDVERVSPGIGKTTCSFINPETGDILFSSTHHDPRSKQLQEEELAFRATDRGKFRDTLKVVQDLERLVARAALGTAGPRDLVSLRMSLAAVPRVKTVLADIDYVMYDCADRFLPS